MLELEADTFALLFHPDKKGLYDYLQKRKSLSSRPLCYMQIPIQKKWLEFLFARTPYTQIEYSLLLERCALLICTMHMDGYIPINWQKMKNQTLTESNKNNLKSIVKTLLQESLYEKFFYTMQHVPKLYEFITTYQISMSTDNKWDIFFDKKYKTCSISYGRDIREGLALIKKAVSEFVDSYITDSVVTNSTAINPVDMLTDKLFRDNHLMEKVQ